MPALKQSIVQSTAANLTTNPFVAPSYLAYSNAFVSNPPFPAPPLIPPSINLVSNMLGPFQSIPSSVVRQLPPNLPPSIPVPVTSTNYPMLANQFNYAQAYVSKTGLEGSHFLTNFLLSCQQMLQQNNSPSILPNANRSVQESSSSSQSSNRLCFVI